MLKIIGKMKSNWSILETNMSSVYTWKSLKNPLLAMHTVVHSKDEERHLQRHDLQLSQVLSLMFQESSHHQQILSFVLLFLMLLTRQDILVQDYLCICKLTLRSGILSCMLLATNGAVSTLGLCDCVSLHQSRSWQRNSESFATFVTHTLANHIRENCCNLA